jgi:RNA polymerase sigma-70 factor (ECF subfamily)
LHQAHFGAAILLTPMTQPDDEREQELRAAFDSGRMQDAATAVLSTYGDEILSFIHSRLRHRADSDEAFAMFAEDLWNGLPSFGWRSSVRTWAYTLARNATIRYASASDRRAARNLPLSCPGAVAALVERVRETTECYKRTAVKDQFRELRERLDLEDQTLLILRVDRNMSWRELAQTLSGTVDLDEAMIERESARLRKAFERVKRELKRLSEAEGLLQAHDRSK